jgi:Domain of unknown function (DUF4328)
MTNPVLPNANRAKTIIIIFYVLLALQLAMMVGNYFQMILLQDFKQGNIDMERATQNDLRQGIIGSGYLLALVFSIIYFIRWFRRAYHNLERADIPIDHAEGWAAGAWFVPLINLFRPFQIMREIWTKTQQVVSRDEELKPGSLLGWWWAAYLLNNIIGNISVILGRNDESIQTLIETTTLEFYGGFLELAAGIMMIIIIRQVAGFEEHMYEHFENRAASEDGHLLGFVKI